MPRLDQDLLKKLAHGKCFIMVGSGVSIDSGYPSWFNLAKQIVIKLTDKKMLSANDIERISKKLGTANITNLLEVFDDIANLISKEKLISVVKEVFDAVPLTEENEIYKLIVKWPINCYLTTNYDSELKRYLNKQDEIFTEYGNGATEFKLLTADCKNTIFKIHGTFNDPENCIITKSDYNKILNDEKYKYWREKIRSVLHMCTVVLIGYSAKDPDFQEQLNRVRYLADSKNPIYMFAADLKPEDIERKSIENNIKVIPYKTVEGKHIYLKKILQQYTTFLPKRNSNLINRADEKIDEAEFASAVFIYTDMVSQDSKIIAKALFNCILNLIKNHKDSIDETIIINDLKDKKITTDVPNIKSAIEDLVSSNYIQKMGNNITLTATGKSLLEESSLRVSDYKDRFDSYCVKFLSKYNLSDKTLSQIKINIRKGMEVLFRKRGIEIARKIFVDNSAEISLTFDIEASLSSICEDFSEEGYDAFISLLLSILQSPAKEIRDYLSLICNGYFVYHVLGHDESAREERLEVLRKNKIFVDSSILIPLVAIDAQNHEYAVDLVRLIKNVNTEIFITDRLLEEVIQHANWAIENFSNKPIYDLQSFQVLLEQNGVKENLFVQGALNYAQKNGSMQFDTYFSECLGEDYKINLNRLIQSKLLSYGITIKNWQDFISPDGTYDDLFNEYTATIRKNRINNDTYRSDFQCETEAELLIISKVEEISFLTQTSNLKKLDEKKRISHWSPESVFRFLQMNSTDINLDNLYNCMVTDMYNNGFTIINEESLKKIAPPYIHQAELEIKDMKKLGINEIEKYLSAGLIDEKRFNYTLPFYTKQLQYYTTSVLEKQKRENDKKLETIENKTKILKLTNSERQDYERMKQKKEQRKKQLINKRKNRRKKR